MGEQDMLRFRIDASILRECVEAVLAVVDEARLKIGESAWKVRAVDPANVALVDLELAERHSTSMLFLRPPRPLRPLRRLLHLLRLLRLLRKKRGQRKRALVLK